VGGRDGGRVHLFLSMDAGDAGDAETLQSRRRNAHGNDIDIVGSFLVVILIHTSIGPISPRATGTLQTCGPCIARSLFRPHSITNNEMFD
jgi:hypothetical protein